MASTHEGRGQKGAIRETLETVAIALLIAFVVRTFLVQLYRVDGESMLPTLHDGDRLVVNKLVYRLRPPAVGEVLIVDDPGDPRRQLVKRVVATAGERIEFRNQQVYINGEPLDEPFAQPMPHYLPDEALTIPAGYIYVMGDNRPGSLDSRVFGPVSLDRVQGRAIALFWPLQRAQAHGPLTVERSYK